MAIITIVGPMFAKKSTTLINTAQKARDSGKQVVMIKYSKDTRYIGQKENCLVISHDDLSFPATAVEKLMDVPNEKLIEADEIYVDEGQFFGDLIKFIKQVQSMDKNLYIAGLDLNHRKENFGQMAEACALSDSVMKLTATCVTCGAPAEFTRMDVQDSSVRNANIAVGGSEMYSPVCNSCYK
jgi:thymidine kinase